jgi:hypothetical protein
MALTVFNKFLRDPSIGITLCWLVINRSTLFWKSWNLLKCVLAVYCQVGPADISSALFNDVQIASHEGGFRIKDGLEVT